ncbi:MAG: flagellar biosynthesis protein FlhA [Fimbriimonadales bacterium]|jgi:flagellar biosynthesis protein FlhA|nr:flagellar biosynthesis protein FlhA [Fimbriimonadales bacterium]GBC89718.1 Flagellar biosynthesis protein FlhA [bacterium HR14]CUU02346.1 flagellar biosynthesis protein FlhA [Armatimonadetes bacterium GBS]CUU34258.1 flagellar biosynthesis protein FlhA [Armatimonadetes bacterium GXS]
MAWAHWLTRALRNSDLMIALAILVVVTMLIVPMPKWMLDTFIVFNFAVSIVIALMAVNITNPLQFSVFPALLLVTTLFRLALSIVATKLILGTGSAGKVIETFGQFVVGGDFVVGVVAFLILVVVQFVVITNGAGRVAEVAARFTLDAMPGKQMAIDADLNAGLIDQEEARRRRRMVELEADFYGAMDGASKFVKGDAIAAVLIILINIIGGFAVGFLRGQGDAMTVLQTYTLLTIGEGLVAQIPALLISTATGLMVTRASTEQAMGQDVVAQLLNYPRVLMGAGIAIALLSLVPGFPKLQFIVVGLAIAGLGYLASRVNLLPAQEESTPAADASAAPPPPTGPEAVLPLLKVDAIELEIGYGLMPLVDSSQGGDLLERIAGIRRQLATDLGFVMPSVRVRDNVRLRANQYQIRIRGEVVAQAEVQPRLLLAMPSSSDLPPIEGQPTTEPVFGMQAYWIEPRTREQALRLGYTVVEPSAVVATHLTEVVRQHAADLLGRAEVQQLLDNLKEHNPVVVQEVVPDLLTLGEVQKVLQHLLREGVPIRDLVTILEILGDYAGRTRDTEVLGEYVRAGLARTITHRLVDPRGKLHVMVFEPALEAYLRERVEQTPQGVVLSLEPAQARALLQAIAQHAQQMSARGYLPVLACAGNLRLPVRKLLGSELPSIHVIAYHEIAPRTDIQVVDQITRAEVLGTAIAA